VKARTAGHDPARVAAVFLQATLAHQQGRPFQADALCFEVLQADSRHPGAWHLRGLLALEGGNTEQGVEWIEKSLQLQPIQAAAHSNIGNALLGSGRPEQALARFERALRLKPDYLVALYNRGNACRDLRRNEEALASYQRVLSLQSNHVQALNNKGLVLLELGRLEEALECCRRAAELEPRFTAAHQNAGSIELKLGRFEAAFQCYTRALELDPAHVDSLLNRGHVLQCLRQPAAALQDYEKALRLVPDSVLGLNNSGNTLLELGRREDALGRYDRALQLAPGDTDVLYNRGAALRELRRYAESARCYADLLRIAPSHDYALGNLFHLSMDCADWSEFDSLSSRLYEALATRKGVSNPLSLLMADSPQLQLACARAFVEDQHPQDGSLGPCLARRDVNEVRRLRVAYVSADFREHPVSYLLAAVLEQHDRSNFEVIGISLGAADGSASGDRMRAACDRFVDVAERRDREVAQLIRELEVDIAVDLMGFTQGMRLGIFAHRCAPVQVSYLGYAGTTGAPYMDYLLADATVIPAGQEQHYSERVVRLPHCYLPNDDRREVGPLPTRLEAGLPEHGFVFCAFTNTYKLNPPVFDIWMRLLREVSGSVLWLRAVEVDARENLRREASARGVEADRLVFAPYVSGMADHLGRHALADLYLDTLPYNAHSTTCDALWTGVPVLTCPGESFASRVAASALTAVGLPELIAGNLEEYERKALELARTPERLAELRRKLARQRQVAPLFDTAHHCRELERAYRWMHEHGTAAAS
jgi:protein O-GlcNAc transferase